MVKIKIKLKVKYNGRYINIINSYYGFDAVLLFDGSNINEDNRLLWRE